MAQTAPQIKVALDRLFPELDDLETAAIAVDMLVRTPAWAIIHEVIGLQAEKIGTRLRGDTPLEQAEYSLLHGRQWGLRQAAEIADAITREYEARAARVQAKLDSEGESSQETA